MGLLILVENDGKFVVFVELWLGNLNDVKNGMVIVFGICVGGGIMLDGYLWVGSWWLVGEVSLMFVD